jgi:protein-S-isoprenylcysteine O-methyltransferase Ste14
VTTTPQEGKMTRWGIGHGISSSCFLCTLAAWAAAVAWPGVCVLSGLPDAVRVVGAVLMAAGLVLWIAGVATAMRAFDRGELVTSGAFAVVRHPVSGLAPLTRSWAFLLGPMIACILFRRAIHREDIYLEQRYGERYLACRRRVNELIPIPRFWQTFPLVLALACALQAQAPNPAVPAWAQPGSATHTQVAPPPDFHRPSTNFNTPIGIFDGQSDIGSAVIAGSAGYDPSTKRYTIHSAGYNIWYTRDEFRYLWKKMSGDVSLAADISYPDPNGYGDRKAVLIIRQDLEDDSKEAIVALHGAGMIHLAERPAKGARVKDTEYRIGGRGRPGGESPDSLVTIMARRIGIEKRGDAFTLWVSLEGEPMHQFGPPITLHLAAPFYAGIGFCSHVPDKSETAVLSDVVLENTAGRVR